MNQKIIFLTMNQKIIFQMIKEFTGQANILTIPKILIDYTGEFESALLLSQLLYWAGKSQNDGWVYKTYSDFKEELGLNEYKTKKAKKKLVNMGILETKIKKIKGNPTLHYRIKDNFSDSFLQFLQERTFLNTKIIKFKR